MGRFAAHRISILSLLCSSSLYGYSRSDFERMVELKAASDHVKETRSRDREAFIAEHNRRDRDNDYCREVGSSYSYEESYKHDCGNGEQSFKWTEREAHIYELVPPAEYEITGKIYGGEFIERWCEVSLGPIEREAASCPSQPEKTQRDKQPSRDADKPKKGSSRPSAEEDDRRVERMHDNDGRYIAAGYYDPCPVQDTTPHRDPNNERPPLLMLHPSLGAKFKEPWTRRGINQLVQQYASWTVDDFEQAFIKSKLAIHERIPADYEAMPLNDQWYLFSCVELYQFVGFRGLLAKFPRCQEFLEAIRAKVTTDWQLKNQIKNLRTYDKQDPLYGFQEVLTQFLQQVTNQKPPARQWFEEQLRIRKEHEERCSLMVERQRAQQQQLQLLCTEYGQLLANNTPHVSPYLDLRNKALQKSLKDTFVIHKYTPHVPDAVKTLLQQHDCNLAMLEHGSHIQVAVQAELVNLLERLADVQVTYTYTTDYERYSCTAVVQAVDIANSFTIVGYVVEGIRWTDVAWTVLDYTISIGNGAVQSVVNIGNAVAHPLGTATGILHTGYLVVAATAAKVVHETRRMTDIEYRMHDDKKPSTFFQSICASLKKYYHETAGHAIVSDGVTLLSEAYILGKAAQVLEEWELLAQTEAAAQESEFTKTVARPLAVMAEDAQLWIKNSWQRFKDYGRSLLPSAEPVAVAAGEVLEPMAINMEGEYLFLNEDMQNYGQTISQSHFLQVEAVASDIKFHYEFSDVARQRMENPARTIPVYILDEIIKNPLHVEPDPQGTSAFMYFSRMYKNGKLYNVEVLYEQEKNRIIHFLYDQSALGPLPKVKK